MKSILFVLTLILCGCEGAYRNENKLIQKAYNDGFDKGFEFCKSLNLDLVKQNKKVQSITFKYDSIMIINFDSSEVK